MPSEEATIPFPSDEVTPPVTKMYLTESGSIDQNSMGAKLQQIIESGLLEIVCLRYFFKQRCIKFCFRIQQQTWLTTGHKKRQADYITPLRPDTLAVFPPWGIDQELVV